jgi:hypothetical protein
LITPGITWPRNWRTGNFIALGFNPIRYGNRVIRY